MTTLSQGSPDLINRTKIIATLGPSSSNADTIQALIEAGVNVFRLNLSHGSHEDHKALIATVRKCSKAINQPVAILGDLQGPKLRTGLSDVPLELAQGESVKLTTATRNTVEGSIATKYQALLDALDTGMTILLDDGKIRLKVLKKDSKDTVTCEVIEGGELNSRKGINIPEATIDIPPMTEKDKEDAHFLMKMDIDYIALSFVQRAKDIDELKSIINQYDYKYPPGIIAKIEKPQALDDIDQILESVSGIMVARGDLGVELPPERVPIVQKQLVELANVYEKPVIIATQMLESMIHSRQPARSDVSDIANAVFDRADAVMLSGETAVGEYPVETVAQMRRIVSAAENSYLSKKHRPHEPSTIVSPNDYQAIAHSASYAAAKADVSGMVVLSNSGSMARRISKLKPPRPIFALTPNEIVVRKMSLLWGVQAFLIPDDSSSGDIMESGEHAILEAGKLNAGDRIVFCAGRTPQRWLTNSLKIYHIGHFN